MSEKISMIVHLPEHQECTECNSFSQDGYVLRDRTMSRFICNECFVDLKDDYPLASKVVEIHRSELIKLVPEGERPGFRAGYLFGTRNTIGEGFHISVSTFLDSVCHGRGTTNFFSNDDVMAIRKISKETNTTVVGLYRTSPSGAPEYNLLDNKIIDDMLFNIVYMIIAGNNEVQIGVKDKQNRENEIGVLIHDDPYCQTSCSK